MAKLRIRNHYGITPNDLLYRDDLSFKAKGLFAYLQSKPDNWNFSSTRIARETKDGIDGVQSGLRELEHYGYLGRANYQNEKGQWDWEYTLREKPLVENPVREKPLRENPPIKQEGGSKKDIVRSNPSEQSSPGSSKTNNNEESRTIEEVIDRFQVVNPSYQQLFRNKTERNAVTRLVKQHGKEEILDLIDFLDWSNKQPYSPTTTSPYQLELNLGKLYAFAQKHQAKRSNAKPVFI